MNRVKVLSLLAGALLPLAGFATPLSYNYVDLSYINDDPDAGDNGGGWQLNGSVSFADNWFFTARYSDASTDPDNLKRSSAGVGYDTKIADATSLYGQVTWEDIDWVGKSDSSAGVEAGLRYAINQQFEINGALDYVDAELVKNLTTGERDNLGFGGRIGGFYDFTPNFALVASWEGYSDLNTWRVGGRWTFAP